jgi:hypothetical protein
MEKLVIEAGKRVSSQVYESLVSDLINLYGTSEMVILGKGAMRGRVLNSHTLRSTRMLHDLETDKLYVSYQLVHDYAKRTNRQLYTWGESLIRSGALLQRDAKVNLAEGLSDFPQVKTHCWVFNMAHPDLRAEVRKYTVVDGGLIGQTKVK